MVRVKIVLSETSGLELVGLAVAGLVVAVFADLAAGLGVEAFFGMAGIIPLVARLKA